MVDILRAVSKEMADFKMHSRAFQSQMLSLQDILAANTQKCFDAQKTDIRWKSGFESLVQMTAGALAFHVPGANLQELISKVGQATVAGYYEPKQMDHQNTSRKIDTFSQQTQRIVQALDQIKQTQDSAEQTLQQSRQNAHS